MSIAPCTIIVGALVAAAAAPAFGATITLSNLSSDAEANALPFIERYVAEGRIGAGGGPATFELALGASTVSPAQTANYAWQSGVATPFSLEYDAALGLATYTVDGVSLEYAIDTDATDIFIRTRSANETTTMTIDNLTLNGDALAGLASASGAGDVDILWIRSDMPLGDFLLRGDSTMTWAGSMPSQSTLAFQFKVGAVIPAPTGFGLAGAGLIGLGSAGFARRRRA
ncbi:MAG: hypothetical protein EA376_12855 [Phycisphaeraceae bacterium]|nr:MAG: hypothetical protein EA376_12855 [Phycisphaeraceae bacterium]